MKKKRKRKKALLSTAKNTFKKKKTKSALKDQVEEERNRFFTTSIDMLCIAGMDGYFKRMNPAFEKTLGFTPEELCARPIMDFVHPDDRQRTIDEIQRQAGGSPVYSFENRYLCKDGSYKWLSWKSVPVDSIMYAVARDITDIKNSAESLRQSELFLDSIIEAIPAMIFLKDEKDLRFTRFNKAGEKLLGFSRETLIGKNDYDFFPKEQADFFTAKDRQVLASDELTDIGEESIQTSDGRMLTLHTRKIGIMSPSGDRKFLLGISEDITEQKLRESELKATKERVESTNKELKLATESKSRFLATMSHEIRTPINGVIGMTGLLLNTSLTAQQRDYAETIRNSADALLTLVNDILDFSKIEAGKLQLEEIDFNPASLIEDIERILGFSAKAKNIELSSTIHPLASASSFRGDPTRLRQVLLNLANNAIKFTNEGTVLIQVSAVETSLEKTMLRFEVKDTGIGIAESVVGKIFEAFSQADSTTTRRYGGTGLGLSISKHLVSLMKGEMGVASKLGHGSNFWFTVELEKSTQGKGEDLSHVITFPSANARKIRILLAEDNVVNQKIAIAFLEQLGHDVDTVSNGSEVIDAIRKKSYDVIFMDCQMPEMDGYQATRFIRENSSLKDFSSIPIIAMTANAMVGDREKCIEAGMNDYVSKPIRPVDLQNALARVLDTKKKAAA